MADLTPTLPYKHLLTLHLDVDAANAAQIGDTPSGRRSIAPVTGGRFEGKRLNGTVLPGGADWVRFRADGVMLIDVRLTLQSDDGALLYLSYEGRFKTSAEGMRRLAKGASLEPDSYSLVTSVRLECGVEPYSWVNDVIAVGIGEQSGFNPVYNIYEIGG